MGRKKINLNPITGKFDLTEVQTLTETQDLDDVCQLGNTSSTDIVIVKDDPIFQIGDTSATSGRIIFGNTNHGIKRGTAPSTPNYIDIHTAGNGDSGFSFTHASSGQVFHVDHLGNPYFPKLSDSGFIKTTGGGGLSIDTGSYLTSESDPIVGAVSGIVKADGAGNISAAVSNTDYSAASHKERHAVTGSDSVFPADPNADKFLKWNDTSGAIEWADAGAGSGATTALDNLASVAINTSLISDADNTDDLGSSTYEWKDLYIDGIIYADEIRLNDSEKIRLGTGQDLEIYHDGTSAYIDNLGTQNSDVIIRINDATTTRNAIVINGDEGSVSMLRQSCVTVYHNTNFTIGTGSLTTLVWNTEIKDNLGEYNTGTGIFTAKDEGIYIATCVVDWKAINTTKDYRVDITTSVESFIHDDISASADGDHCQSSSVAVYLTAGQTIKIQAYQNSGGNETIQGGSAYSFFSVVKVA